MKYLLSVISLLVSITFPGCSEYQEADSVQDISQVDQVRVDSLEVFLSVEEDDIARPGQLELLPDQRLAILDTKQNEVLVYKPDGTFEHRSGGRGKGPGEFVAPRIIHATGSTIDVVDVGLLRVNRFDLEGNFIENYLIKKESSHFGYIALGNQKEYYAVANGAKGKLVVQRFPDADSVRYFGEAMVENPPPVSASDAFYSSAANGEIPDAIANDLMMVFSDGDLFVFIKAFSRLQKYSEGELVWDEKIDLPVNEVIFNTFVERVKESEINFGVLHYLAGLTATRENIYLLWNGTTEHPQQVVKVNKEGEIDTIFQLPSIERRSFRSLAVDEYENRIYLSVPNAGEIYRFTFSN